MKTEYLVMLSEIIDKMGIANEIKNLEIKFFSIIKANIYSAIYGMNSTKKNGQTATWTLAIAIAISKIPNR